MGASVLAVGAVSGLGVGSAAFDVGEAGDARQGVWAERRGGRAVARAAACDAARMDRPQALLELALTQVVAELDRGPEWRKARVGLVVGSSSGGFSALERALRGSDEQAWQKSAYFAPLSGVAAVLGKRPERLVSLYAACASSALALGLGLRWLELGLVDLVIAGGYDAESDLVCAGFDALKATAANVPRPFRAERDGLALGEGAALLALGEAPTSAYGSVRGFGASTDAVHVTAPDRTGASLARAAELALQDAALTPDDVELVSAHGTGTAYNDAAEAAALRTLFAGQHRPALHAFKGAVGHTLGAAAALETLAVFSAFQRGVAPASLGGGTPLADLPATLHDRNTTGTLRHALKLSTAFGGCNAALVLDRAMSQAARRVRAPREVFVAAVGAPCRALDVERIRAVLRVPPEKLPRADVLSELAVAAAAEALLASGERDEERRLRTGVVVGSVTSTIEADAAFAERVSRRGPEHAEPRRFPATSPNVGAGHVAIAFGLHGPSHAVGAGAGAAFEALAVAHDWIAAGDADAMLVVAAEHGGPAARSALAAQGIQLPETGAVALLLSAQPQGTRLAPDAIEKAWRAAQASKTCGFEQLGRFVAAARLPET